MSGRRRRGGEDDRPQGEPGQRRPPAPPALPPTAGGVVARFQHIHAHFDDFEFTSAGLFELLRQRLGAGFQGQVVVCTDGQAGHHARSREETGRLRLREQRAAAAIGGFDFRQLTLPDGRLPREGCLQADAPLLAALWKAIRDFAPAYLIAPPVVADPLAGIHVDHAAVADAVRRVAYMVNVPHAFTPEYPDGGAAAVPCRVPVILNAYDHYAGQGCAFDLAIDVEDAFATICRTRWCHQSQIREWLPWVAAPLPLPVPADQAEWERIVRAGFRARNAAVGIDAPHAFELFTVTAWGGRPDVDALLRDLPGISLRHSRIDQLRRRFAGSG